MTSSSPHLERLDFVLPDFLRLAWVSDSAREVWSNRFQRVVRAWSELEWLSVASHIRDCALMRVSSGEYEAFQRKLEPYGLKAVPLDQEEASNGPSAAGALRIIVGAPQCIAPFQEVLKGEDHEGTGRLLGYPDCCRKAFEERCSEESFFDPTWLMAVETAPVQPAVTLIEIEQVPFANMLLRWVGIRAIPHLPCSFSCGPSIQFGRRFLDLGIESGFGAEMDCLEQILSWPVEWSGLHGIAEIKTPVLKISTKTEATAKKLVVRWKGSRYPEEGAQGVAFPYRMPDRPLTTGSPSFRRALEQAPSIVQIQPLAK